MRDSFPNDCYKNFIIGGKVKEKTFKRFPELPQFPSTYPLPLPSGNENEKPIPKGLQPHTQSLILQQGYPEMWPKATWRIFGEAFIRRLKPTAINRI